MKVLLIALAGSLGALSRYGIGELVGHKPVFASMGANTFGTMGINVVGSFLIGFILTAMAAGKIAPEYATVLTVGFCGAFTTFSTFSWDTFALARHGSYWGAMLNITLSLVLGINAAALGYFLGRSAFSK